MKRRTKPMRRVEPALPDRENNPLPAKCDESRRRFLRQLGAGTSLLAGMGLPSLSNGQSLHINFEMLENHPLPGHPVAANALATADLAPIADRADTSLAQLEEPQDTIVENRALWIEPGYLILLRWSRPADDEGPAAALEGSVGEVSTLIQSRVSNVDSLHNLDQLHQIETALVATLAPRVAPANIEVLHLDHDCTTVCSVLNPSIEYPEPPMLLGDIAPPGW